MGRRFNEVTEEMKLVPYKVVAGENGDARVEINGQAIFAARDFRHDSDQAEGSGRSLPGREGHQGRDHGAGLFQRFAAPGHQGRRPDRRSGSDAHHQRADGGGAGLRAGQEEERDHRGLRLRRRHVRHFDSRSGRRRGGSEVHQRRHAPGRRQHRPAHHRLAGAGVQEGDRRGCLQGPDGAAAAEGSRREGQDRAVDGARNRDQSAVPDGRCQRSQAHEREADPRAAGADGGRYSGSRHRSLQAGPVGCRRHAGADRRSGSGGRFHAHAQGAATGARSVRARNPTRA